MSEPPLPSVVREALPSVPVWARIVSGTTWSAGPKRMRALPSASRWKRRPPAERERFSVAETGSLSGQATPWTPSPLSLLVTRRNSSHVQGSATVGTRTSAARSRAVLAISTRGSWRKGTP